MLLHGLLICYAAALSAARNVINALCAHEFRQSVRRFRCATGAEDEHLFTLHVNACMLCKRQHAGKIGVVAVKLAAAVYDGVHRADALCRFGYLVKIRDNVLLVRNRNVYRVKLALCHKLAQLVRSKLMQLVFVVRYLRVNFARIAVRQMLADKSVFHLSSTPFVSTSVPYRRLSISATHSAATLSSTGHILRIIAGSCRPWMLS